MRSYGFVGVPLIFQKKDRTLNLETPAGEMILIVNRAQNDPHSRDVENIETKLEKVGFRAYTEERKLIMPRINWLWYNIPIAKTPTYPLPLKKYPK